MEPEDEQPIQQNIQLEKQPRPRDINDIDEEAIRNMSE